MGSHTPGAATDQIKHPLCIAREQRNLSQQGLADAAGLSKRTIQRAERGLGVNAASRQILCDFFGKSAQELGLADRPQLEVLPAQIVSKNSPVWSVPYQRNPLFTGREDLLERLYDLLHKTTGIVAVTQAYALSGLGGIGKTQTVLEYLYRYVNEYEAIFWLKADTQENLLSDFLHIATLLRLPEGGATNQEEVIAAIHQWMREREAWLLILDNADDLRLAREFIPAGGRGHILLTTRAQAMGKLALRLDVDEMDPETGALFLLRRSGRLAPTSTLQDVPEQERSLAIELVRELGGLPLALDQAAAYMEETPSDVAEYLRLYHTHRQELLRRRGGFMDDHPEPVMTTWSISFTELEQANPAAADLLRVCAFCDPDALPEELLLQGATDLGPCLASAVSQPLALYEAIGALGKYSFIRRQPAIKTLSLHRLVQVAQRASMEEEQQRQWAERVVRAMARSFPSQIDLNSWQFCQRLLAQALNCAQLVEQWNLQFPEAAQLLNQSAYYLRDRARYREAESLYLQASALWESLKEPDQAAVAQVAYNLGRLYFDQGKYAEAENYYQRALTVRERVLGPVHSEIARCLNSLALLYWKSGIHLDKAERTYQRALAMYRQTLGEEHTQTAHCWNNLALLHVTQGRYEEAEQIHRRVLAIREKVLPAEHLDTAQTLQNLACLYLEQQSVSHYEEAEQLCRRSLEIREYLLGPDHTQVARSLNNLALLYVAQGRYEEADTLYQRVLRIREQTLGIENPKTLETRREYASLLQKRRQKQGA